MNAERIVKVFSFIGKTLTYAAEYIKEELEKIESGERK